MGRQTGRTDKRSIKNIFCTVYEIYSWKKNRHISLPDPCSWRRMMHFWRSSPFPKIIACILPELHFLSYSQASRRFSSQERSLGSIGGGKPRPINCCMDGISERERRPTYLPTFFPEQLTRDVVHYTRIAPNLFPSLSLSSAAPHKSF